MKTGNVNDQLTDHSVLNEKVMITKKNSNSFEILYWTCTAIASLITLISLIFFIKEIGFTKEKRFSTIVMNKSHAAIFGTICLFSSAFLVFSLVHALIETLGDKVDIATKTELAQTLDQMKDMEDNQDIKFQQQAGVNQNFALKHSQFEDNLINLKTTTNVMLSKHTAQIKSNKNEVDQLLDEMNVVLLESNLVQKNNSENILNNTTRIENNTQNIQDNTKKTLMNTEITNNHANTFKNINKLQSVTTSTITELTTDLAKTHNDINVINTELNIDATGKSQKIKSLSLTDMAHKAAIDDLKTKNTELNTKIFNNTDISERISTDIDLIKNAQVDIKSEIKSNTDSVSELNATYQTKLNDLQTTNDSLKTQMKTLSENVAANKKNINSQDDAILFIQIYMAIQNGNPLKPILDLENVDVILNNLMMLNNTQHAYKIDTSVYSAYTAYILKYCIDRKIADGSTKLNAVIHILDTIMTSLEIENIEGLIPDHTVNFDAFHQVMKNAITSGSLTSTFTQSIPAVDGIQILHIVAMPVIVKQAFLLGVFTVHGNSATFWSTLNGVNYKNIDKTYNSTMEIDTTTYQYLAEKTLLMSIMEEDDATIKATINSSSVLNDDLITNAFMLLDVFIRANIGKTALDTAKIDIIRAKYMAMMQLFTDLMPSSKFPAIVNAALSGLHGFFQLEDFSLQQYETLIFEPISQKWLNSNATDTTKLYGMEQLLSFAIKLDTQSDYIALMKSIIDTTNQGSGALLHKMINKIMFITNASINGLTSTGNLGISAMHSKSFGVVEKANLLTEMQNALMSTNTPANLFKLMVQAVNENSSWRGNIEKLDKTLVTDGVDPAALFDAHVASPTELNWLKILNDATQGMEKSTHPYRKAIIASALSHYTVTQNPLSAEVRYLMMKGFLNNKSFTLPTGSNNDNFIIAILTAIKSNLMTKSSLASAALGHNNSKLDNVVVGPALVTTLLMNLFTTYTGYNTTTNATQYSGFNTLLETNNINGIFGIFGANILDIDNVLLAISNFLSHETFGVNNLTITTAQKDTLKLFALFGMLRLGAIGTTPKLSVENIISITNKFTENGLVVPMKDMLKFYVFLSSGQTPIYTLSEVAAIVLPLYNGQNFEVDYFSEFMHAIMQYDLSISQNNATNTTPATNIPLSKIISLFKQYLVGFNSTALEALMHNAAGGHGIYTINSGYSITTNTVSNSSKYDLINLVSFLSFYKSKTNKGEIPSLLKKLLTSIVNNFNINGNATNKAKWNNFGQFMNNEPMKMITHAIHITGSDYAIQIAKVAFESLITINDSDAVSATKAGKIMSTILHTLVDMHDIDVSTALDKVLKYQKKNSVTFDETNNFDPVNFDFVNTNAPQLDGQMYDIFSKINVSVSDILKSSIDNINMLYNGDVEPTFVLLLLKIFIEMITTYAILKNQTMARVASFISDILMKLSFSMVPYLRDNILPIIFSSQDVIAGTQTPTGNTFFANILLPKITNSFVQDEFRPTSEVEFQKLVQKIAKFIVGVGSNAIITGLTSSTETKGSKTYTLSFPPTGNVTDITKIKVKFETKDNNIVVPSETYEYEVTFR